MNIEAELPNQHEVEFFLKNTFKFSEKASKDFSNMLNGVFNWKNVVRKLETLAYTGSLESVNGSIELTGNWSDYFESEE
jgi:mRNA-degrading endonuclease YafQ of YafQ-DinJ toxin-antitoxin module